MAIHVGRHRIKEGKLDQFVDEWKAGVVPLREAFGFIFIGAWALPESNEVVWVVQHDGDFDEANRAYYESNERKQLSPDPAVHIEESSHTAADVIV